ncbi:unnamed protein product [Linum tenue]|uniref:Uncharacterized protein n=1 Tax=Linum tenue TaxID=586396 RepID=A0AAV0KVD5_9ROSI|nr:unnamed protein product [Linum tenue]
MERKALLVCSVVGVLGLLSVASGFGAEATRIKVSPLTLYAFLLPDLFILVLTSGIAL